MTADDGSPIKVAIYDQKNRIITNGPLSSVLVKIVALDGEFNKENKERWSENSFKTSIVHCRPGRQPLFANELYLRLENGVADLCGIKSKTMFQAGNSGWESWKLMIVYKKKSWKEFLNPLP